MIKIDGIEVSENEYLQRIEIFDNDEAELGFCDEFLDLFEALGVPVLDRNGELRPIEDLTESLSEAYLNYMDFVDFEFRPGWIN